MTFKIDLAGETARLEREFQKLLQSLPAGVAAGSATLVSRIGIKEGRVVCWADQFTRHTLLYPLLQSQGLAGARRSDARMAVLAHLCLLIHAFAEDRLLDGQIALQPAEHLLSKHLLLEAMSILRRLTRSASVADRDSARWLARYADAQLDQHRTDPGANRTGHAWKQFDRRARRLAVGRASPGLLATLALARSSDCGEKEIRKITRAYEAVIVGLQWVDDLTDWPDDFRARRPNFLLQYLECEGVPMESVESHDKDMARTAREMIRTGIYAAALASARTAFETAARIQRGLGCRVMVRLIEGRLAGLESIEKAWAAAVARDLSRVAALVAAGGRVTPPTVPSPLLPHARTKH